MKAVTKGVRVEADELCLIPKVPVHRVLNLVPDRSPEVVLEVVHDHDHGHDHDRVRIHVRVHIHVRIRVLVRIRGHSPDHNLDRYLVHDPDLVQVQNQGVRRGRKARRDQDPDQRRADRVRDQVLDLDLDRGRERVNHGQDRVVVQGKADRKQDQGQVLQLVQARDQGQDREVVHNQTDEVIVQVDRQGKLYENGLTQIVENIDDAHKF